MEVYGNSTSADSTNNLNNKTKHINSKHAYNSYKYNPYKINNYAISKIVKIIMLTIFLIFLANIAYEKYQNINSAQNNLDINNIKQTGYDNNIIQTTAYKCDGRIHCSQMSSLEEARFFLKNCPDTKMDGDSDGEPCERQFSR
ncbi:MAG: hypothetical protein RLZZ210_142 [Pseudomonadota bacterium]|jgi:hypothetical protein